MSTLDSLDRLLLQLRMAGPSHDALWHISCAWRNVVGDRLARRAQPVRLSRGTLTVHVVSSTWAQELQMMGDEFLHAIARRLPNLRLRRLRFYVGELPLPLPPQDCVDDRASAAPSASLKMTQLPEELARALASIHDDELRSIVADTATRHCASHRPG